MLPDSRIPVQEGDIDDFLDSVSEVSRLIDGLHAGTITPEYIDSKILSKGTKRSSDAPHPQSKSHSDAFNKRTAADQRDDRPTSAASAPEAQSNACGDASAAAAAEALRQQELARKVEELKARRAGRIAARSKYQLYVAAGDTQEAPAGTDYRKWDLWCPSDDEDALFDSLTPNDPQLKAMEKDIEDRHRR